jgi:phosphotransferase system HPr-like phosphotransfer protein
MNIIQGSSPDGRQTLDEFIMAHRRIITDLYEKKHINVAWETDRSTTFGGFDAKQLTFTYRSDTNTEMREIHIMSLGRNEGRGVRIKISASSNETMMPLVTKLLESY